MIARTHVERARSANILDVASRYVTLRRASASESEFVGPCPVCRDGVDRFAVHVRKGVWSCRKCNGGKRGKNCGGDVVDLVMRVDGVGFAEAVERLCGSPINAADLVKACPEPPRGDDEAKHALASAARIVSEIRPLTGTLGEAYLRDIRKIDVAAIRDVLSRPDAIGWHGGVYFNEPGHPLHGQRLDCIVGIMTDAITARPTGAISRTYIGPDLRKIGKAKTLGAPMGIVRLTPDDEVGEGVFLAEGAETALAGMSIGLRPMWSTGSSGLMASFPVLSGIEALNVIVDHDLSAASERAAREVEARWLAAGREVSLFRSDAPGDLNDALKGGVP